MSYKRSKSYHYWVADGEINIRRGELTDFIVNSKTIQNVDTLPTNTTDCGTFYAKDLSGAKEFVKSLIKLKQEYKKETQS